MENPLPKPVVDPETREALFDYLAHGDDKHRAWLKKAIEAFFEGKPRPEVE